MEAAPYLSLFNETLVSLEIILYECCYPSICLSDFIVNWLTNFSFLDNSGTSDRPLSFCSFYTKINS